MDDVVIRVDGLSKQYRIGVKLDGYKTLRETLTDGFVAPFRRTMKLLRGQASSAAEMDEKIWALKDVSFEIKRGEVVGIIGHNGAGKTTLLTILSRITEPTEGQAEIHGRVGSLLEVGTGFHPELTGRENIYLNGAILGMKKRHMDRKFDEIVAFAEIDRFIDTPVKHYSSGMYVRLAFAVAAHLDPEILLVDEVLAVGDASFQKKCLGKMGDVAKEGRTVLFVSHNMGAISRLCPRALLLDEGKVIRDGESEEVISAYLKKSTKARERFRQHADPNIPLCLLEAEVVLDGNTALEAIPRNKPITVQLKYSVNAETSSAHVYSNIISADGTIVFGTSDADVDQTRFGKRKPGIYDCQFQIPPKLLNGGDYSVNVSLGIPYQVNFQENDGILTFTVVDLGQSERVIHRRRAGVVWFDIPWEYPTGNPFSS
jgi:lipopolysaccharide transport system ATP-binding protein